MNRAIVFAAVAALSLVGCKKKESAPAAAGSSAAAPAKTAEAPPAGGAAAPAAAGMKSCEELGGKTVDKDCQLAAAPFEVVWTGKFDTDARHPEPGALFKVTNKSGMAVRVNNANLYAYDKSGKQVDMTAGGSPAKFAQDSMGGMLELAAGETKEMVHSMGKANMPADMDTLQMEITSWSSGDDKQQYSRNINNYDTRAKDGAGWN